jgi:uncharacterized membrane protein
MAPFAVAFGVLLCALGAWGYLGAEEEHRSVTALIPAFVGIALVLLGLLAFREAWRKHAMHAAAALGLLGFVAAGVRVGMKLARDGNLEGRAAMATTGMALLCAVFVALCVNSFIAARRARRANNPQA